MRNRQEKVKEVNYIAGARTNVSTGEGADPSKAPEGCIDMMEDVLFRVVLFGHSHFG